MVAVKMSTLNTFAEWATKYASWADLKAWLQASEPSIEILEFEGSPFVILKNGRDNANANAAETEEATPASVSEAAQVCRSVVWNTATNTPCCVAPFAARRDQKTPMGEPLRLEDFVEGVMVNVFRYAGVTHVTTRSRLDADGTFYSDKTFRQLFDEAMWAKNTTLAEIEALIGDPASMPGVSATFVSLVLAHPEHRVVRSVDQANFWAIYRGVVNANGSVDFYTEDLPDAWRPKTYSANFIAGEWADLKAKFEEVKESKPWYWQGLVVHTGLQRWRFRNADHDRVRRDLRGTESNPFGRFLRLRANKRVQEYLRVYPEDNDAFQGYEHDYRAATKTLYAWYCRCHKEHTVAFKSLPKSVQPLVFGLHKAYLETLRPNGKTLRIAEVIDWLTEHLKTQYGVPNMLRIAKEEEQPPESSAMPATGQVEDTNAAGARLAQLQAATVAAAAAAAAVMTPRKPKRPADSEFARPTKKEKPEDMSWRREEGYPDEDNE